MNDANMDIRQSTRIEIDKNGVVAAAATGVMVTVDGEIPATPDVNITFNRSFLYIIMEEGVPLFIGTVYNPAQ